MTTLLLIVLGLMLLVVGGLSIALWLSERKSARVHQQVEQAEAELAKRERDLQLAIEEAKRQSRLVEQEAQVNAQKIEEQAQLTLRAAAGRADDIVTTANKQAEAIAGSAYDALRNADEYRRVASAMKSTIEGYGLEYLMPRESLLDDLAESFSHKDAGQLLKTARSQTKLMARNGQGASCDYAEASRRAGAEAFVLDAFNGKVDSILSRIREDNAGTLSQEINDAFTLVNFGGKPFRNARITSEYLSARLEELRWGAAAQLLRKEEQEEQRRIREQMREEEKARREYERAMREADKEEDVLRRAMAKAEAQMAAASEEQRMKFEQQLADLNSRLVQAEERNRRAISMAQQTRKGYVYIISNVGSFGENVYKIGMTRRLDPMDRIYELGDSSVPFDFDVHALLLCDDAPALENRLHKHFLLNQINKVNHRKEFFETTIAALRSEIEVLGIEAQWTMTAEATEYRETLAIERMIAENPRAREQWIARQLVLDPQPMADDIVAEGSCVNSSANADVASETTVDRSVLPTS